MPKLSVCSLERDYLLEAYPLIRCLAGVEAGQWTKFADHLLEQGGGVLVARTEDCRVHGVAGYVLGTTLRHGKVLRVEVLAAIELGGTPVVRDALAAAIDDLARRLECPVVLFNLDAKGLLKPQSGRRRAVQQLGLSADSVDFVRCLGGLTSDASPTMP